MPDVWDERRKAHEEEYFRKKDREALERLRAKRAARAATRAESADLHCPKCDGSLIEINHEGVQIDRCNKCNGVWLDSGELEILTKHKDREGWVKRLRKRLSAS